MIEEYEVENMIIEDELGQTDESWHITDDNQADWALEKITALDAEYKRKEMVARNKIEQIQTWLSREKLQAEQQRSFFEMKLKEYFNSLPATVIKETKTQKSYRLPSGTLRLKQQQPEYLKDENRLLEWVKTNKPRFVRIKESVDWAGLKELTTIAGDKVIDAQTGEVIDGIMVAEREPKFIVEVR